jgi:hypothetical protein
MYHPWLVRFLVTLIAWLWIAGLLAMIYERMK